jgi:DNA-binding MarR family transcriptional regulator
MPKDPLLFTFFNEISIIDQLAGTLFERALPANITRAQFGVLNHFVRLGLEHKAPSELASAFEVTRGTMTSTLARMERNGLISVEPDPADGRGKLVRLTEHGGEMREQCIAAIAPLANMFAPQLTDGRVAPLMDLLTEVRKILDAHRAS